MPSKDVAGRLIRDIRTALGWSQLRLALEAGVSQPWISQVERGTAADVSIETIDRLLNAMGARLVLNADAPYLANRRQRDPVHARCASHVARRLQRAGWEVAAEVEVGGDRSRGWIDVLAWHPATGVILVVEIKTELRDLGAIERHLNWYEREAWAAARRNRWRPRRVTGCLLMLATEVVDQQIRDNRESLDRMFPLRAPALDELFTTGTFPEGPRRRGLALIDPRSHRRDWLRKTRIDGRRSPAPYVDYIDFLRRS